MTSSILSLEGKVAIVTGGTRGIGYSTVLGLARAGAIVTVVSRNETEAQKVAREAEDIQGNGLGLAADMANVGDIQHLVKLVRQQFGKVDILVNNAAVDSSEDFLELSEETWDQVMNVNLKGPVFLAQAVSRVMKQTGGGAIVNVSSISGILPDAMEPAYTISKAGLTQATKAMVLDLSQHNIRVNTVAPGGTRTEMMDSYLESTPGLEETINRSTPLGRMASPDEVANAIVFLASEASGFTTGATLIVDGGVHFAGRMTMRLLADQ